MARQKRRNAPAAGDRPAPKPPEPHVSGARPPLISPDRLPRHVAIVMDGNGRWAKARNLPRTEGHARGEESLFDVIAGAIEIGVKYLSAYAFSWKIAILVAIVMLVVVASYRQNVHAYPSGGGDYEVATVNLGPTAGLTVGSALLVDYVLTVAVSIAVASEHVPTDLVRGSRVDVWVIGEDRRQRAAAELVLGDVLILDAPVVSDSFAAATSRQLVLAVPQDDEESLGLVLAASGDDRVRVVGRG